MNRLDHLLVILMEECGELAQDTAKALRFGIYEQRDLPTSNLERMQKEYNDLLAVVAMINEELCHGGASTGLCHDVMMRDAKRAKVEKYLEYSGELGRLEPTTQQGE